MLRLGESIEQTGAIPEAKLRRDGRVRRRLRAPGAPARRRAHRGARHEPGPPGRERRRAARAARRRDGRAGAAALGRRGGPARLPRRGRARLARRPAPARSPSATSAAARPRSRSAPAATGATWVRSIDIGSMRLTSRLLGDDPPGEEAVARGPRRGRARSSRASSPPAPELALAVGGSARALRDIVGREARRERARQPRRRSSPARPRPRSSSSTASTRQRVRTLAAGAIIFEVLCERLGVPLRVGARRRPRGRRDRARGPPRGGLSRGAAGGLRR